MRAGYEAEVSERGIVSANVACCVGELPGVRCRRCILNRVGMRLAKGMRERLGGLSKSREAEVLPTARISQQCLRRYR